VCVEACFDDDDCTEIYDVCWNEEKGDGTSSARTFRQLGTCVNPCHLSNCQSGYSCFVKRRRAVCEKNPDQLKFAVTGTAADVDGQKIFGGGTGKSLLDIAGEPF